MMCVSGNTFLIVCFISIFINDLTCVLAMNDSIDRLLSPGEVRALENFKRIILKDIKVPFMNSDFYLIRWLRKTHLDVHQARKELIETIAWRERNNISKILGEDWSDLAEGYAMSVSGHDKMGRPLMFIDFGDWDLRATSINGMRGRFQRYLTYALELGMQKVLQAQREGTNVTRYVSLSDVEGFNIRQHGCLICTAIMIQWTMDNVNYYPSFSDEMIILNMPSIAVHLLNTIRAAMPPDFRNLLKSFDVNRNVWMRYLDERIDRSERAHRYGGTIL